MHHLRALEDRPEVDVLDPETGEPTGEKREATDSEMLNRWGLVPLGRDAEGRLICDCHRADDRWRRELPPKEEVDRTTPGERVSDGRRGAERYETAPPGVAEAAWRVVVYRGRTGGEPNLRSRAARESGVDEGPSVSPRDEGEVSAAEHRLPDPPEIIERARREAEEGRAARRRVPVREVEKEDIVAATPDAHRFAGEAGG